MKKKSLSAKKINHNKILSYLNDNRVNKVYLSFNKNLYLKENFAVAVSGGPDSLSAAYCSACYAIHNNLKIEYYIINHNLRYNSSTEAKIVKKKLKTLKINAKIINWYGKKPIKGIPSSSRSKRYDLLIKNCKKNKIRHLVIGHQSDDLIENFFIRLFRGSGLRGLVSLGEEIKYKNINLLRPMQNLEKSDLVFVSKKVFKSFVTDPTNFSEIYQRPRIRKIVNSFKKEGFDKKKFLLTIENLKSSNKAIKYYVEKNLKENSKYLKKRNMYYLSANFFDQAEEIVFRSFSSILKSLSGKYYEARGRKIVRVIDMIQNNQIPPKISLGGCLIQKYSETVIISREKRL